MTAATSLSLVWGTAAASLVIQRDPASGPGAGPSVIEGELVITNTSYVFFKGITFRAKNTIATNVVRVSARYVPSWLFQRPLNSCSNTVTTL